MNMRIDKICHILNSRNSNDTELRLAISIVKDHILYCKYHNIDMLSDPLLSRVLKWV